MQLSVRKHYIQFVKYIILKYARLYFILTGGGTVWQYGNRLTHFYCHKTHNVIPTSPGSWDESLLYSNQLCKLTWFFFLRKRSD